MLSCSDCNVFLHCSSEPRIEACYGISFARYNAPYPQLSEVTPTRWLRSSHT